MSRTFRRTGDASYRPWTCKKDACTEWLYSDYPEPLQLEFYRYNRRVPLEQGTKEYKRKSARYHSDAGTTSFKEPGPSWFRNMFCERSQRQDTKQQLKKYMIDQEYEVCLNAKNHLPYWT